MRPKQATERSDRALEALSARQHYVLTLAQLADIGLSPRAVCHRTATGRLRRMHRGVYALHPPTRRGCLLAAVLACGPSAVLSHQTAAELWGLDTSSRETLHVSVASRAGRTRTGVRVHSATLSPADRTDHEAIPCTTVARTLLDLAASGDRRTVERAIDRAELLGLFDLASIEATIGRSRGRPGVRILSSVLAGYEVPAITRSAAEERLLTSIRAAGLPRPRVNSSLVLDGAAFEPDQARPPPRPRRLRDAPLLGA
jgi:hypothetical protein